MTLGWLSFYQLALTFALLSHHGFCPSRTCPVPVEKEGDYRRFWDVIYISRSRTAPGSLDTLANDVTVRYGKGWC